MRDSTVMFFIGLLIGLAELKNLPKRSAGEAFTFEEFLYGEFSYSLYPGQWLSDNELEYTEGGTGNIVIFNVETNESRVFLSGAVISDVNGESVQISADRKFALMSYDRQSGYRHSSTSRYIIYDLEAQRYIDVADKSLIQYAQWAPVGSSFVYVLENNIYYQSKVDGKSVQITTNGVPGIIYNGVPDWVYEEEIIGENYALWFSPEGDKLMFAKFDDSDVPEITFLHYGTPGDLETQYPTPVEIRYPKAGVTNPKYGFFLQNLTNLKEKRKSFKMPKQSSLDIFYSNVWADNEYSLATFTNRVQNESVILNCSASTSFCNIYYEDANTRGWVNAPAPRVNRNGTKKLLLTQTAGDDFDRISLLTEFDKIDLNKGNIAVTGIIGWDEVKKIVYYLATEENLPSRTQVYGVYEDASESFCLSCQIKSPEGRLCQSASASFSKNYTYVILTCLGPDPAVVGLYRSTFPLENPILVLQDNAELRSKLAKKALPEQVDLRVKVPGDFEAEVRLLLPPGADVSGKTKYPLLIEVYAGPDSKQISDNFGVSWESYLTTNLSVIYGYIDGRGSARKGHDMLYAGYRALGTVEIEDQIGVTKYLQETLPYIDSQRTAIWGWSYGGYATGKTLETDVDGVFRCGISVAPVTSWIYYDSMYTERYMGLPTIEDNLRGYIEGDLLSDVSNLHNKQYYLIHGNGDDNVHYQQSMLFSRALELNDVLFQQQSYPDENHSLGSVSKHLYHSMDKFWKKCFELIA